MAGERLEKCLRKFRERYGRGDRAARGAILGEFCCLTGYHRKYAMVLLKQPADSVVAPRRNRGATYPPTVVRVLEGIWKAAGYPSGERLKAMLPLWLKHVSGLTPVLEASLLRISGRQIDRRLSAKKQTHKKRIYGRTKPGTLLKHHIPVKTDSWDVREPGFAEIDTVAHCGESASGEFIWSLNMTDIYTGWCETRAVMGKGEAGIVEALESMRQGLPFTLKGIDSDNGSEFINYHLYGYCQGHDIQFTRGRPYKKNDNAHIEQKNWTQVRKLLGWDRYDSAEALEALNTLYAGQWRQMTNLFQPSVKLTSKERVGSKVRRCYDAAKTPLDRAITAHEEKPLPASLAKLLRLREAANPFQLSAAIEQAVKRLMAIRCQKAA